MEQLQKGSGKDGVCPLQNSGLGSGVMKQRSEPPSPCSLCLAKRKNLNINVYRRQKLFNLFPVNSEESVLHVELCQPVWEEKAHAARLGVLYSRGCCHP